MLRKEKQLQMSFFCLLVQRKYQPTHFLFEYTQLPERVCKFIRDTPAKTPKLKGYLTSAHDFTFKAGP